MKIDKTAVGQRIKQLRGKKNMSMEALAQYVGVSGKSTINEWEKGRSMPQQKNLEQLSRMLGVPVDYLKFGSVSEYGFSLVLDRLQTGQDPDLQSTMESVLGVTTEYYEADAGVPIDKQGHWDWARATSGVWHKQVLSAALHKLFSQIRGDYEQQISSQGLSYNNPEKLVSLFISISKNQMNKEMLTFPAVVRTIKHDLLPFYGLGFQGDTSPRMLKYLRKESSPEDFRNNLYLAKLSSLIEQLFDSIDDLSAQYTKDK